MTRESSSSVFDLLRIAKAGMLEFRVRKTGLQHYAGEVHHAIDGRGRAALLIPLSPTEEDISDTQSRAISCETFPLILEAGAEAHRFMIVRCEDSDLEAQFSLIVDDMLRSLGGGPVSPGSACISVLDRWRVLLESTKTTLMSAEEQIGLIAELHLLEVLLRYDASLLRMWMGPDQSRHDFSSSKVSLEVKATTIRDTFPVSIHGDRQLEDPAVGPLYLYAEQLELATSGESVSDVVGRVMALVSDKALFAAKLLKSGYRIDDAFAYQSNRYSVLRAKLCLVDEQFPRITRSTISKPVMLDFVHHLQYSIDIAPLQAVCGDNAALEFATSLLVDA